MDGKDFLSVADLAVDEVGALVGAAGRIKALREAPRPLDGRIIALLFEKPVSLVRAM